MTVAGECWGHIKKSEAGEYIMMCRSEYLMVPVGDGKGLIR